MSNVSALIRGRPLDIVDGAYLERSDPKETALEEYLRGLMARAPSLVPKKRRIRRFVAKVNALDEAMRASSDAKLCEHLRSHCASMRKRGFDDELLAEAFAAVREASARTLGKRPYDVQLIGAWIILQGMLAEMQTGEGKTLVAALAGTIAAATGAATHVVTVNDYLAERDAKTNTPLFEFFKLSVGIVLQGMQPDARRVQYACAIVYVSNKELVFDYLKDRIATNGITRSQIDLRRLYARSPAPPLLLPGLHVAIVDEADSVLIDEARTPLIISETEKGSADDETFKTAVAVARTLITPAHFEMNAHRDLWLTPLGEAALEETAQSMGGVWRSDIWRKELVQKALTALHCFHRDQHYIVAEGKIQIVDEFTGRVMPDRSWERGLHQMIECKEDCELTGQRRTLSRMTYQRFFRRYLLLGGMTGTASEVRSELRRVYDLDVMKVATHRPSRRRRLKDRCFATQAQRWNHVVARAKEISEAHRSVLIGTRSVEASEQLSTLLQAAGIEHTVLNARQDKTEADTVAQAGQPGRITVATNMAGRGTDIHLHDDVKAAGGLHVILTEFHESSRVDRQLFGRAARQGEPGSVEALTSLEDDLFSRHAAGLLSILRGSMVGDTLPPALAKLLLRTAQFRAERHNLKIRLATLKEDRKLQSMLSFAGTPN